MTADNQFERVTLERLRALEKRTSRVLWIVALLAAAFVWRQVAYHPEVRSDRFYLLDDAGRVRGMWRVRDNRPALILRDEEGNWKTVLSTGPEGSELRLVGTLDATTLDLHAGPQDVSLTLRSGPDPAGQITLSSESGNARFELERRSGKLFVLPPESRASRPDSSSS